LKFFLSASFSQEMKLTTTHPFKRWREILGTLATGLILVSGAGPAEADEE